MHFFEISEFPFHGGHNHSDYPGEWDDRQVMAGYPLVIGNTIYLYYRGTDDLLPVNGGAGVVSIGVMSASVIGMNAYNWNKRREINPIIRYDSYGPAVTGTGSMLSDGSGYEGGSPVWVTASAAPVLGGDFNDHAAVVFGSEVFLYVSIVGNPSGTRVVLYKAPVSNPVNFAYAQEIQFNSGNFGSTPACIYNINGRLWMICGRNVSGKGFTKILRGSLNGIDWTDYGDCMPLSSTAGQIDYYSQIVGRGFESPNYVYALIPSQPELSNPAWDDWPEGIVLWRCAKADLGRDSFTWERWGLVALRGPTMGGLWQLAPLNLTEEIYATAQMWGLVGFDNINTDNTNSLRTTEYAGLTADGGWSTKHQWSFIAGSFSAYTDFDRDPVPAGQYLIRHTQTGNYLAATPVEDSPVVLRDRNIGANNIWHLDRELTDFHRISHAESGAAGTRILRPDGTGSLRGTNLGMKIEAAPTAINNFAGQWFVKVIEDQPAGQPIRVAFQNRWNGLCLTARRGNDASGVALVQQPMLWNDVSFEFELIPIKPAGTEVAVVDTDFPMAIGAGDIVTTEQAQTLTDKTLTDPTIDGGVISPTGFGGFAVNSLNTRQMFAEDFIGQPGKTNTECLQEAIAAAGAASSGQMDRVILDFGCREYTIDEPLITTTGKSVSLRNGRLIADPGGNWTDTNFMLRLLGQNLQIDNLHLDGNLVANLVNHRAFGGEYTSSRWERFRMAAAGRGFYADAGSTVHGYNVRIRGLTPSDTGFATQANRLGTCWHFGESGNNFGDSKLTGCTGAFAERTLLNYGNMNSFVQCHFFNGLGLDAGTALVDTVNVENREGMINMVGCYIDNGYLRLYDTRGTIVGCHFLYDTGKTTLTSFMQLHAQSVNDTITNLVIAANVYTIAPALPVLGFIEAGGNTWSANLARLTATDDVTATRNGLDVCSWNLADPHPISMRSSNAEALIRAFASGTTHASGVRFGASADSFVVQTEGSARLLVSATEVQCVAPFKPTSSTVAGLSAITASTPMIVYVTDESGGAQPAFYDGTNWRRFSDRNVVS